MKKVLFAVLLLVIAIPLMAQDPNPEPALNIWTIISAILAILSSIFGTVVLKAKGKVKQIIKLGKESIEAVDAGVDLAETVVLALDDNTITSEEKRLFKEKGVRARKEASDVKAQWKIVWGTA